MVQTPWLTKSTKSVLCPPCWPHFPQFYFSHSGLLPLHFFQILKHAIFPHLILHTYLLYLEFFFLSFLASHCYTLVTFKTSLPQRGPLWLPWLDLRGVFLPPQRLKHPSHNHQPTLSVSPHQTASGERKSSFTFLTGFPMLAQCPGPQVQ